MGVGPRLGGHAGPACVGVQMGICACVGGYLQVPSVGAWPGSPRQEVKPCFLGLHGDWYQELCLL
jgi:hypothetical protein